MNEAVRPVEIVRVGREPADVSDVAAVEEPLEIRLDGQSFVVTMRTPGADPDLASGFLLSEQIVRAAGDIADIRHCTLDDNILYVTLTGDGALCPGVEGLFPHCPQLLDAGLGAQDSSVSSVL